jgi:hypothetical protein
MGAGHRAAIQSVNNPMVDLVRSKLRTFLFRMSFLSAYPSSFARRFSFGFCGWLDNVAGRRLGGIAGVFLSCGQGVFQFSVLGFQLKDSLLQPSIALPELFVLSFQIAALLLP